jgi:hypothetical protein
MPAAALAAARAVAVLGTAATAERAGWLTGLDGDSSAEAIGMLMAERLIEGDRALRFVHPLVRSAVYQDLAPPVRQRWHKRARAEGGEDLDPQLHANLAIELGAAGLDRERAIRHAREAVLAMPRLMSRTSTALAEAVAVLLFAGLNGEAREGAQAWLRLTQQRGWPRASALALRWCR